MSTTGGRPWSELEKTAKSTSDSSELIPSKTKRPILSGVSPCREDRFPDAWSGSSSELRGNTPWVKTGQREGHATSTRTKRGVITDDVLRRIERDLDLEDLRMEA